MVTADLYIALYFRIPTINFFIVPVIFIISAAVELYKINPEKINMFLDGIYNTVLFKDVMQRKGITDKNVLERVTKYLYDNIGNRTSMKSISDRLEGIEKNSSLKKINDKYPKYILTLDDDFDGIKKINVLDWLLNENA